VPQVTDQDFIAADWPAPASVIAFTTTRDSGTDALPESADREQLRVPQLQQVHGTTVVQAEEVALDNTPVLADAIVSRTPGLACRIQTADCLPILLCTEAGDEVAAVHAGWRGLAAGVIEAAVSAMQTRPEHLLAWIGPAISQAAYEVGVDVRDAFLAATPPDSQQAISRCFAPHQDRYMADLPAIARVRMQALGLHAVFGGEYCTWSDAKRFHSFRRSGAAAGRMASMIWINRH